MLPLKEEGRKCCDARRRKIRKKREKKRKKKHLSCLFLAPFTLHNR
jgi:hypothetical protein